LKRAGSCGRLGHVLYGYFNYQQSTIDMKTSLTGVTISPVNMEDRKSIGIKAGDTVKVHQRIQDKGKTRIQIFEGLVLARKHGNEPGATFTVRKVASGVGVEKIYPLYSPNIDKIEITKRAKVRRSKLYYIREKVNREIKRQMRRMNLMSISTESEIEAAARTAAEAAANAELEAQAEAAEAARQAQEAAAAVEAEVVETPVEEVAAEVATKEAPVAEEVAQAEVAKTPVKEVEEIKEAKKD